MAPLSENIIKDWFSWVAETADYHGHGEGELAYPALSLAAEVGELQGLCVRVMRKKGGGRAELNASELTEPVRLKMAGEAYDVFHCLAFVIQELGFSLEDIIEIGRKKLEGRIQRGSAVASHRLDEKSLVGKAITYLGQQWRLDTESTVEVIISKPGVGGRVERAIERALFYQGLEAVE